MSKQNRILLIEDDKIEQIAFNRLVKDGNYDYDVSIADSVAAAKDILAHSSFDIIILDYSLGDGTAFDLIELVDDVPIIFTTGVGDEETAVKAMKAGVYDYIIKDVERNYIKLLPGVIENVLRDREDKEQLRMLYQAIMNIEDSVYITDMNYKLLFTNNAFNKKYGYIKEEVIGEVSSMLWWNNEAFEESKELLGEAGSGELHHKGKYGNLFPVLLSRTIVKDSKGKDKCIINIARDISEVKQAKENILRERDRAQQYLDIAGVMIILIDTEHNLCLINKKGCEVLGYDKLEILDKNWFDHFVPATERKNRRGEFVRQVKEQTAFVDYHESPIIAKNGNEKMIAWHNTLLRDKEGRVTGILSSGEDITIRIEIDKMKSEFVNTVSHEIRTPLTVILGICQLLLSTENLDIKKIKKYFNTMYVESRRLSDLVNDFLDIQRMENGGQFFDKERMCIVDAVEDTIALYETNGSHRISLDVDQQFYSPIFADSNKIRQLIMNYISNAIKYSPEGSEIIIRIRETEEDIYVAVIDQGIGIPEEYIPNLFQKFYRVEVLDHRKVKGTGLGLAICKEIALAHEGEVGVKSQVGKGSEFYFIISKIKEDAS